MSKIQSLNLSVLRNEEAFGFLQQVQAETKHLTDVTIESIVDNFSVALEEFDKALYNIGKGKFEIELPFYCCQRTKFGFFSTSVGG